MHIDDQYFGIKFDMNAAELRTFCEKRAEYHDGRRKWYEVEEERFKGEEEELAQEAARAGKTGGYSNTTTASNRERMTQAKLHHQDRVKFFAFAAKHLLRDHYMLTKSELIDFELIPAR